MLLLGRILFGAVFFKDAADHFSSAMIKSAEAKGVFLPHILVPASGVIAIIGGLLIIFGFKTKLGAGLIVKVLIPVTIVMHDFWNFVTPHLIRLEFDQFVKNLGLLGAAFMLIYFGPGPWSVDAWLKRRKEVRLKNLNIVKLKSLKLEKV
jgi:uncharacterized membrane protein YphA (DoxX/SURF4 family)